MRVSLSKSLMALMCGLLMAGFVLAEAPYTANITEGNPADSPRGGPLCTDPGNLIANCSFETGDFTSWATQDISGPFIPMLVGVGGLDPGFGFFVSSPTEGTFAALHGFDGEGPGFIEIAQDVSIPPAGVVTLNFDYRGAWELATFGATLDRTFEVQVQPTGGGAAMQTDLILTATAGTINLDTGDTPTVVDLSAFADQDVRVAFVWNVPESGTGPGFFQLDNVMLTATGGGPSVIEVPTVSSLGLALLILLLGIFSVWRIRRQLKVNS